MFETGLNQPLTFVKLGNSREKDLLKTARKAYDGILVTASMIESFGSSIPSFIRGLLSHELTDQGYKVEAVDDATEALDKLKNEKYNLILLDIKMPGMSGIELYERIQKVDRPLSERVVFITGDAMAADTRAFLSRTKASHITKPFQLDHLEKEIARVMTEGV